MIRINEDPNGLKDSPVEKNTPLLDLKRPLRSDCNGYGFADENNISIHLGFGKCAGERGN